MNMSEVGNTMAGSLKRIWIVELKGGYVTDECCCCPMALRSQRAPCKPARCAGFIVVLQWLHVRIYVRSWSNRLLTFLIVFTESMLRCGFTFTAACTGCWELTFLPNISLTLRCHDTHSIIPANVTCIYSSVTCSGLKWIKAV